MYETLKEKSRQTKFVLAQNKNMKRKKKNKTKLKHEMKFNLNNGNKLVLSDATSFPFSLLSHQCLCLRLHVKGNSLHSTAIGTNFD